MVLSHKVMKIKATCAADSFTQKQLLSENKISESVGGVTIWLSFPSLRWPSKTSSVCREVVGWRHKL